MPSTTSHVSSSRSAIVSRTCVAFVPGGQAPVDAAHVVARLVEPGVAGFAARPAHVALVVAVQQAVELAVDEEIELPERCLAPADLDTGHDAAATSVARSKAGPSWSG